ncbi:hypothetical protein BUALT_Bualt16G0026100 [Buddleja alternifolia]|uniref:Uncharacterized protein n=1 Tax=Buddleja alternifolia TaxID=168488 RepID=A0AAV6WHV3_9LAMI|nr:hypothetical protein BUALT_Bualt16G0026100 [Buddleja alternifolia]
MRPEIQHPTATATAAAAGGGSQRWNSPLPFLFGAIAIILGVIALALVIMACSYRKSSTSSSESSNDDSEKAVNASRPEMEPRIVVIMAGESNPTHLAKPMATIRPGEDQV